MAKVLVVDDIASERELMGKVVSAVGGNVVYAMNGEEALAKAKSEKPDLILLDVVMPSQDGFSTCRKLKKDPETAVIPVVLVSAKSQDSDKAWGKRQGCADYIVKPFSPGDLGKLIKQYI